MIKTYFLVHRRADLSRMQFVQHWRDIHGPLSRTSPSLRRHALKYAQNHLIWTETPRAASLDGIAELWTESPETFVQSSQNPDHQAVTRDGENFLDRTRSRVVSVEPGGVVSETAPIKFLAFHKRREDCNAAAFLELWRTLEAGLVAGVRDGALRGFQSNTPTAAETLLGMQFAYDGLDEIWFNDLAQAAAFLRGPLRAERVSALKPLLEEADAVEATVQEIVCL